MEGLGKLARDTGFVILGLAVIRYQKAAVRRREVESEIASRLGPYRNLVPEPARSLIPKPPA